MTNPTSIAVDLAWNVFEIAANDDQERILFRRRASFYEDTSFKP